MLYLDIKCEEKVCCQSEGFRFAEYIVKWISYKHDGFKDLVMYSGYWWEETSHNSGNQVIMAIIKTNKQML